MVNSDTYQRKLDKRYPNERLRVLEYRGARNYTKIQCCTCGKIYEYAAGGAALAKSKTALCHSCADKSKKFNNFVMKLSDYKQDELQILAFSSLTDPCSIECKRCHSVFKFKQAKYALNKTRSVFCSTCFPQKDELMQKTREKFIAWLENNRQDWLLVQDITNVYANDTIKCKCLHCGRVNEKTIFDYMRGRRCFCQVNTEQKTTKQFEEELDSDYSLLSEYKNANTKVLLRHESCGFVYSVSPHNYLCGKRCPKCSRKESKGEKKIRCFLDANKISYIQEYPVNINGHLLRFDFFLPVQNVFIEYQGEQHYHAISYFGGETRYKKQVLFDNMKRLYAEDRLYEIKYCQNVESELINILQSSTTIRKDGVDCQRM